MKGLLMKMMDFRNWMTIFGFATLCCVLVGCASLQSQMNSYESSMRSFIEKKRWNSAYGVVSHARFDCLPEEQADVADWRERALVQLKTSFARELQNGVEEVRAFYDRGDVDGGDRARQQFKARHFGGDISDDGSPLLVGNLTGGGVERGVPEVLVPCFEFVWAEMLSDRSICLMNTGLEKLGRKLDAIDEKGRRASITECDSLADEFSELDKQKETVNKFLALQKKPDVLRWTPIDGESYCKLLDKMTGLRDGFIARYKTRRWNVRVYDRKMDYGRVRELIASGNNDGALQIFAQHDPISEPKGLIGVCHFDDQDERSKVAGGGLGVHVAKQLIENGLTGVQYHRNGRGGLYSALVVARAPIPTSGSSRSARSMRAVKVAQQKASGEFIRFLETSISSVTKVDKRVTDGLVSETVLINDSSSAEAKVSNLVLLCMGAYGDEVVVILGWRTSSVGGITPAPMRREMMEDGRSITISPSVGAYL